MSHSGASTSQPLSIPDLPDLDSDDVARLESLDTQPLIDSEALDESELEDPSSESKLDSEINEDGEEIEMEEQYADEKDELKLYSREEDPTEPQEPTHAYLTLTPPNVEEIEVTHVAMDIDTPSGLDPLTNHIDKPIQSRSQSFHLYKPQQ